MSNVTHQRAEQRSLALHREVARRLRERPELLGAARERVRDWLETGCVPRFWAEAWDEALEGDLDDVIARITDTSESGRALRQASPFAGGLGPRERWELVDGSIGELSPFHETFGYYAQGVGPVTAILPRGWQDRLVRVESPRTRGAVGLCIEIHDLVVSKYLAGPEKDMTFVKAAIVHGLVEEGTLRQRLEGISADESTLLRVASFISRDFAH